MARYFKVRLGVPKLGVITEIYNFDDVGDCSALDMNVANGCSILSMDQLISQWFSATPENSGLSPEAFDKRVKVIQAQLKEWKNPMNTAEDLTLDLPEEDAEIIPFPEPKPAGSGPKVEDWLRSLPEHSWFVSKAKGSTTPWLDFFGISRIVPEAVMLASRNNLGGMDFHWCDSETFSKVNRFVAVIAQPEESNLKEEANPDKEAGEQDG